MSIEMYTVYQAMFEERLKLKMGRKCTCCSVIVREGIRTIKFAKYLWQTSNGNVEYLCTTCTNFWCDFADDDENLEPVVFKELA